MTTQGLTARVRQRLGALKANIQVELNGLPDFQLPVADQALTDEAKLAAVAELEEDINDHLQALEKLVKDIAEADAAWNQMINRMTGDQRATEDEVSREFNTSENAYVATWTLGETTIAKLKRTRRKIERAKAVLEQKVADAADSAAEGNSGGAGGAGRGSRRDSAHSHSSQGRHSTRSRIPPELDLGDQLPQGTGSTALLEAIKAATLAATAAAQAASKKQVQLPSLKLKKFAGKAEEYPSWWQTFKGAIVDQEPSKALRLQYLLNLVDGPAKDLLIGLEVTDDNWTVAVNLLEKKYGDSKTRVWDLLRQLKGLTPCENFADVKTFQEKVEKISLQLTAQKHSIDPLTWLELVPKLTPPMVRKMQDVQRTKGDSWNFQAFRETLERLVKEEEEVQKVLAERKKPKAEEAASNSKARQMKSGKSKSQKADEEPTLAYANVKDSDKNGEKRDQRQRKGPNEHKARSQAKRQPKCNFCEVDGHWTNECKEYSTLKQRKNRLKELSSCYRCTGKGHSTKECPARVHCFNCKTEEHHTALCPKANEDKSLTSKKSASSSNVKKEQSNSESDNDSDSDHEGPNVTASTTVNRENEDLMKMVKCVKVRVFNPKNQASAEAVVFFDGGSHESFVRDELRKKLELPALSKRSLPLVGFNSQKAKDHSSDLVRLGMKLSNGSDCCLDFLTTPDIICKTQTVLFKEEDLTLLSRRCLVGTREKPDILIGVDLEDAFKLRRVKKLPSGFILTESIIGPLVWGYGRLELKRSGGSSCSATVVHQAVDDEVSVQQLMRDHMTLENIGIEDPDEVNDDDRTHQNFKQTLCKEGGRYQVSLPYNEKIGELPSNYGLARGRAKASSRRMTPNDWSACKASHQELLAREFIEKVENPKSKTKWPVHYLAWKLVKKVVNGKTKHRLVFDGGAKNGQQVSLNQCLERGPVLLNNLAGVLLRQRMSPVAVMADVEKAFLQVSLRKSDRDVTRFLWPTQGEEEFEVYRFKRLPFGLKPSPFLLAGTVDEHLKLDGSELAEEIRRNLYVDNVLLRAQSAAEAANKCSKAKSIFATAEMPLREFVSNCPEALTGLSESECLQGQVHKVLGMRWDVVKDRFLFQLPSTTLTPWTLRNALKVQASLYDPLGFLSPVIMRCKFAVQEMWKANLKWDDQLPNGILQGWLKAIEGWEGAVISVKRAIGGLHPKATYQIHVYCDASGRASGCAAYLRSEGPMGTEITLIMAKGRIKPLQGKWTIPRLELLGVLLGCRLAEFVTTQLDTELESVTIWTDASCVLDWLRDGEKTDRYVRNHVNKIHGHKGMVVRHVGGNLNPADVISRGCSVSEIRDHPKRWWSGPEYLKSGIDDWPEPENQVTLGDSPIRKDEPIHEVVLSLQLQERPGNTESSLLLDPNNFSDWRRLRRVGAFVLKFLRKRVLSRLPSDRALPPVLGECKRQEYPSSTALSAQERNLAGKWLIRETQQLYVPTTDTISQLDIREDSLGLLRCYAKLEHSDLSPARKYPMFLDPKARLTKLIVKDRHVRDFHSATKSTLTSLRRSGFWIPSGHRSVESVIRSECRSLDCLRFRAKPFRPLAPPQLPEERVQPRTVFHSTGIDYAGPFTLKEGKVWVALYTCMVYRCLHLEVVTDCTSEAFLLSFRRFMSAHAVTPRVVYSDNQKSFETGSEVLIQGYAAERGVRWEFTTPVSPWRGGFYEVLVKLIKRCMRRSVAGRKLRVEIFETLVKEIACVVNSRPLTYSGDLEISHALTPNDFLHPNSDRVEEPDLEDFTDTFGVKSTKDILLENWARTHRILSRFKDEFRTEYLSSLRERKNRVSHQAVARGPRVGEVALIAEGVDDSTEKSRLGWKLGRIIELFPSRDGVVRTVKVLRNGKTLKRPVNLLFPLEVDEETNRVDRQRPSVSPGPSTAEQEPSAPEAPHQRSHRMRLRPKAHRLVTSLIVSTNFRMDEAEELDYSPADYSPIPSSTAPANPTQDPSTSHKPATEAVDPSEDLEGKKNARSANTPSSSAQGARGSGRLGEAAIRMVLNSIGKAKELSQASLGKELAQKAREMAIQERAMDRNNAWPKWSERRPYSGHSYGAPHQRRAARSSSSGYHAPTHTSRYPREGDRRGRSPDRVRSRSRQRSSSPLPSRARDRDRRGRNPDRVLTRSRHASGSRSRCEKRTNSGTTPSAKRHRRRTPRPIMQDECRKRSDSPLASTQQLDALSLMLSEDTLTGLEPFGTRCVGIEPNHRNCSGTRVADVAESKALRPILHMTIPTPMHLILVVWATTQSKGMAAYNFVALALQSASKDLLHVWENHSSNFNAPLWKPSDITKALEIWIRGCFTAKKTLCETSIPIAWENYEQQYVRELDGDTLTYRELNDLAMLLVDGWLTAINRHNAKRLQRKFVDSPTIFVGDTWACQLANNLSSTYLMTGKFAEVAELIGSIYFYGTRELVILGGRDAIVSEEPDSINHYYDSLKELVKTASEKLPYVRVLIVDPPRMISHDSVWLKLSKRLRKLAANEDFVHLPQLNNKHTAPSFLRQAVEEDGSLKELGACIVKAQVDTSIGRTLAPKDTAFVPKMDWVKGKKRCGLNPLAAALVTLMCLITGATALNPMICPTTSDHTVYDIANYGDSCLEPLMMEVEWKRFDISLYTPNDRTWSFQATCCKRNRRGAYFYTDWLGNEFETAWHEIIPVPAEQCRQMAAYHHCRSEAGGSYVMAPDAPNSGQFQTNNILKVEHAYFQRAKNISVENCLTLNVSIVTSTALEYISASPALGGTRGCRFGDRQCLTSNYATLVWDKPRHGPQLGCPWIPLRTPLDKEKWQGEVGNLEGMLMWRSLDQQMTLTFKNFRREKQCSKAVEDDLVISDQGTAVKIHDHSSMMWQHSRRKRQVDREQQNQPVKTHQLAAQLTAEELHLFELLANTTRALSDSLCSYRNLSRSLIGMDPTSTIRTIFQDDYLQARLIGTDLVEVWHCTQLENVTFVARPSPSGSCFKYLPIVVGGSNETKELFLHSRTMIASSDSPLGSCDLYQTQIVSFNSSYRVRVDQRTGEIKEITSEIRPLLSTAPAGRPSLTFLPFVNMPLGSNDDSLKLALKLNDDTASLTHASSPTGATYRATDNDGGRVGWKMSLREFFLGQLPSPGTVWYWIVSAVVAGLLLKKLLRLLLPSLVEYLFANVKIVAMIAEKFSTPTASVELMKKELSEVTEQMAEIKRQNERLETRLLNQPSTSTPPVHDDLSEDGHGNEPFQRNDETRKTRLLADKLKKKPFFQ